MAAADRNVKLQDFDGITPPIIEWIAHITMCQQATGWTNAQTAERVKLHIKGNAMIWLQNRIREQTPGLDTWFPDPAAPGGPRVPNLRTLLVSRFQKTKTPAEQARLRSTLTQSDSEDVATFFDRVEAVQFAIDETLPAAFVVDQKAQYDIIRGQLVLSNFINGLKPDIRMHVTTQNVATTDMAKEAAIAYEMANRKKGTLAAFNTETMSPTTLEEMATKIAALALQKINTRGASRGRGYTRGGGPSNYNSSSDSQGCDYCGYLGHDIGVCNIKKKDVAAGSNFQRSPYYAPGRIGRGGRGRGRSRASRGRGYVNEMGRQVQPTYPTAYYENPQPQYTPMHQIEEPHQQMGAFRFFPEN